MFGLFYMISHFIGVAISGTKKSVDNAYYKQLGQNRYNNGEDLGAHTYYDAEGRQRDLSTNHIMFTYRKDGDLYIEDTKTFKIRNLSEEKRNKEIQKIKNTNPNVKAVHYKYWDQSNSPLKYGIHKITGSVYKDVNDGQLYLERYITWRKDNFSKAGCRGDYCAAYFYLRTSDGKIVSVSDKQTKLDKEKNSNEDYDAFIKFFNSEQELGGFVVRNRNKFAKGKENFYINSEAICNCW